MIGIPTIVTGAAGIGIVAALWNRIKIYGSKLYSLCFIKTEIKDFQIACAVRMLLTHEFKCSTIGTKQYNSNSEFVRPLKRNQLVGYEMIPSEPTIWWRNYKFIIVSAAENFAITFIRGMYKKDELIIEAINYFNQFKSSKDWRLGDRFFIRRMYGNLGSPATTKQNRGEEVPGSSSMTSATYAKQELASGGGDKFTSKPLQWVREELGQPQKKSPLNDLSLKSPVLEAIKEAFLWRESEIWFKGRGIPWKRGFLLYGEAGTGKTAFVRALGQELNMPIISFDLATMTNRDLADSWNAAMSYAPCIALFEDIDAIFHGRENIASSKGLNQGLTFDCLLNTLDGVENTDGVFVVVTTNNIQHLDPSIGNPSHNKAIGMSTRPGRIDRAISFENLDEEGRKKMAIRILEGFPKDRWEYLLAEGQNDTGAQFQERCCRLALKLFWEFKKEE